MDANVSTMTMPKTMPVQNLLRYISFKALESYFYSNSFKLTVMHQEQQAAALEAWSQSKQAYFDVIPNVILLCQIFHGSPKM